MDKIKDILGNSGYEKLWNANKCSLSVLVSAEPKELAEITECSLEKLKQMQVACAEEILNKKIFSAFDLEPWQRISTGCNTIDNLLRGGFPVNGIIEIVGSSGVGKTQMCLQLALQVQLPENLGGLEQDVVFICTEDPFPSKRFHSLAAYYKNKHGSDNNFEDRVYVNRLTELAAFQKCLFVELPHFVSKRRIGLIVIDSIAGVFRSENDCADFVSRSKTLTKIATVLNKIQDEHNCAIVVVNQVVETDTDALEPCLGLAWASNLTYRFTLYWDRVSSKRKFEATFAPDIPKEHVYFQVTRDGIQ